MTKPKFNRGTVVIECNSIEFSGKDIIQIANFQDFLWLVGDGAVFKLENAYYILSPHVVYVWVI